jgi:hypothetical protein
MTSLYLFLQQWKDPVFALDPVAKYLALFSGTYYLGDLMEILRIPIQSYTKDGNRRVDSLVTKDLLMIVHHLVCATAFLLAHRYDFMLHAVHAILMYEFSTIWLKIRWFLIEQNKRYKQSKKKGFVLRWVERLFVGSFVIVRLVYGLLYVTPLVLGSTYRLFQDVNQFPLAKIRIQDGLGLDAIRNLSICASVLVMLSNTLNGLFFYGIVKMVRNE